MMQPRRPPSHCSPSHFSNVVDSDTCLSPVEVHAVATELQAGGNTTRERLHALHSKLGTRPGQEATWLKSPVVARRPGLVARLEAAFRPPHPRAWLADPRSWLSNIDIDAVMRQYQAFLEKTHGFRFVGVVPRDFAASLVRGGRRRKPEEQCVTEAVCNMHVRDLVRDGVRQAGIVFNLDKHTGPGSHWTAMYVCVDPAAAGRFGAFFYDSLGRPPPLEMRALMARLRAEVSAQWAHDPGVVARFKVGHNTVRKQFANTECGVYSIFFLVAAVQTTRPLEDICRRAIRGDDDMFRLRSVLFRPPDGQAGGWAATKKKAIGSTAAKRKVARKAVA